MSNAIPAYSPGIVSLSGFAYQIKIFLLLFSSLQGGMQIEFETLDDIAIQDIVHSDAQNDTCLKATTDSSYNATVYQVKQTAVSAAKSRNILYNWLLALNTNRNITEFVLYVEKGYSISTAAFSSGHEKEYSTVSSSNQATSALISQVKKLYHDDEMRFQHDYEFIVSHYRIVEVDSIDDAVAESLKTPLHLDAPTIGPVYAQQRVDELFTRVCARIMTSIGQRAPFISKREEFMQICDDICRDICPTHYAPDYSSFARLHGFSTVTPELQSSRAYQQLVYCQLDSPNIFRHLLWEQYYRNIRQHYLTDAQQNKIECIEDAAYENHANVVLELQEDGNDTPRRRLLKTKQQPISDLHNEHSRWGAYVFLTNDSVANQISWKDDADHE